MQSHRIPECLVRVALIKDSPPPAGRYMQLSSRDVVPSPSCLRCAAAAGRGSSPEIVDFWLSYGFGCPASLSPFQPSQEPLTLQTAVASTPLSLSFASPAHVSPRATSAAGPVCTHSPPPPHVFQMISDRFSGILPFLPPIYPQSNLSSVCFLLVFFSATGDIQIFFDPFQNKRDHPELSDRDSPGHFFFLLQGASKVAPDKTPPNKH